MNGFFVVRFIDRGAEAAGGERSTDDKITKPIASALKGISKTKVGKVVRKETRPEDPTRAYDESYKAAQDSLNTLQANDYNIFWLGQDFIPHPLIEMTDPGENVHDDALSMSLGSKAELFPEKNGTNKTHSTTPQSKQQNYPYYKQTSLQITTVNLMYQHLCETSS